MKKNAISIILGFTLLFSMVACCFIKKERSSLEYLEIFGKSWGLMKYHHSGIGKGGVNWDRLFLEYFSSIASAESKTQFNRQLNKLFMSAGNHSFVKKHMGCDSLKSETMVDFSWLHSSHLSNENRAYLQKTIEKKGDYRNRFVSDSVGTRSLGYARFYEDPMDSADLTKVEIRLLGLFRYWNIIEYYFPYKDLTDLGWSKVLSEYIPDFVKAANKEEYYECLLRLSTEICDGHASIVYHPTLRSQFFGRYTVPFTMKIVENKLVVNSIKSDSLARITGIKIGDIVDEVEGESIQKRIEFLGKYVPRPNKAFQNSEICRYVLNGNIDSIGLKIIRDSKILNRKIHRYTFSDITQFSDKQQIKPWNIIDGHIGYANMGELNHENLPQFFHEVRNTRGLILDFRAYPDWEIFFEFLGHFYDDVNPFTLLKSQCLSKPGTYTWHTSESDLAELELKDYEYHKPIFILVDERTLSFGEYFVMALQVLDHVQVIGSQTAGEDGNQVGIDMPGGMKMFMSSLGIFYPNGDPSQRVGVKIDEPVHETINDIKHGIDRTLNQALLKLGNTPESK